MLVLRGYAQTSYGAKSWRRERRVCARIEATRNWGWISALRRHQHHDGLSRTYLRHALLRARPDGKSQIKLHKSQLASDRTSCRSPLANQIRLILHTAAYWLMLELRDAIPKNHPLAVAEFVTLREKLLKIGARIVETASRIKLALATACPQAGLFPDIWPTPCSQRDRERRGRDSVRTPQITHPSNSSAFEMCRSTQRK